MDLTWGVARDDQVNLIIVDHKRGSEFLGQTQSEWGDDDSGP